MFKAIKNYFKPESSADDVAQFLPDRLAIMETPPHPAPRIFLKILMVILVCILAWSILGKTEIVAVSQGVIISTGKSKTVQVFDKATVTQIYVRDGDIVKKGDKLVELDQGLIKADLERIKSEMAYNQAEILRTSAMIDAIDNKKYPVLSDELIELYDISPETAQKASARLQGDYDNLQSRLNENQSRIRSAAQEIATFKNAISQKQNLLTVKNERMNNYKTLAAENYLPKNRYLEIQEEVISLKGEIAALRDRISEKNANIAGLKSEANVVIQQAKTPTNEQAQEARRNLESLNEQLKKAEIMMKTTLLTAPVSGTVQQISVNTIGGVLNPAQPVMVIVPSDSKLEAEVTFLNQDIGFLSVGQPAHIKVESFPYTKYGMIDGTLSVLSGDAINDEKLGMIYKGRVALKQSSLRVGNKDISLVPGMRVTAEVKTDTRRLIEYFLSPIMTNTDQAFRER